VLARAFVVIGWVGLGIACSGCGRSPFILNDDLPVRSCEDWEPGDRVRSYDVELSLTADDSWDGFVDGMVIDDAVNAGDWMRGDTLPYSMASGCHTIAIHGRDVAGVLSGFIASVSVDGRMTSVTGDGSWRVTGADPGGGWEGLAYDDRSWAMPPDCQDTAAWGDYWPEAFYEVGASWIWSDANCRSLGEAWFRLDVVLP